MRYLLAGQRHEHVPGPGGYTLLFGGLKTVSVVLSSESDAVMKTRRELEWNA